MKRHLLPHVAIYPNGNGVETTCVETFFNQQTSMPMYTKCVIFWVCSVCILFSCVCAVEGGQGLPMLRFAKSAFLWQVKFMTCP